jgi:hypothetical protein
MEGWVQVAEPNYVLRQQRRNSVDDCENVHIAAIQGTPAPSLGYVMNESGSMSLRS